MFGLFKKTKIKPSNDLILFLHNLVCVLPSKYNFLIKQINSDFILGLEKSKIDNNIYSILLNADLYSKYEEKICQDYYILENLFVWESKLKDYISINISISNGIMISIELSSINFKKFDFEKIDLSKLKEKHFKNNNDKEELFKILGKLDYNQEAKFDFDDTFKIELPEGDFYTIKNLGDGNYLAVNTHGNVFELIHDPYCVKKIGDNVNSL